MTARSVAEHALTVYYDGDAALAGKVLDNYARELAAKIQARSDEARAQEWGRNSGKRAYLTGMEIARKLITPKEPT